MAKTDARDQRWTDVEHRGDGASDEAALIESANLADHRWVELSVMSDHLTTSSLALVRPPDDAPSRVGISFLPLLLRLAVSASWQGRQTDLTLAGSNLSPPSASGLMWSTMEAETSH